ncbi:hypothetical protein BU24DRAFT_467460 [Aaosphaeria arxii CBS 175.79]|uniref:Uncharacterized protein n=1 Tax=Aaosphaeria arxii CBS 175.79 TaxID=1450172 RepID=A0A6A5XB11_9PLEO|nr:uncharacterized protein BU24DRAFT_467460 [Aaosphaeria arxii CBS 175.79]KAF2009964.1 hypothetical protein BU24DRAFT_467460 [Aaosphaeria arxii CBS 175.79]
MAKDQKSEEDEQRKFEFSIFVSSAKTRYCIIANFYSTANRPPYPFPFIMKVLAILGFLLLFPILFFIAFLALSSCMGENFRARIAGMTFSPRNTSFGRFYARGMGSGAGQAGWEQIEMEDMLGDDSHSDSE